MSDARPNISRRAGAEALAAFALVFAGCGAIVANARYDGALGALAYQVVRGDTRQTPVEATGHA